jgi:hypothetical protein
MRRICVLSALLALGACASVVQGVDQSLAVMTEPAGASCNITRDGDLLGSVYPTPGVISVDKSKGNIMVECERDGYERTLAVLPARFDGMTWGNAIIGGLMGAGIDVLTGAMHRYPNSILVRLKPAEPPRLADASGAPSSR